MNDGSYMMINTDNMKRNKELSAFPIDFDDGLISLEGSSKFVVYTKSGDKFRYREYNTSTGELEVDKTVGFNDYFEGDIEELHGPAVAMYQGEYNLYVEFTDGTVSSCFGKAFHGDIVDLTLSDLVPEYLVFDNVYGSLNTRPVCIDDKIRLYTNVSGLDLTVGLTEYDIPEGFDKNEIKDVFVNIGTVTYVMNDGSVWQLYPTGISYDETLSSPELKGHLVAVSNNAIIMDDGNMYRYSI